MKNNSLYQKIILGGIAVILIAFFIPLTLKLNTDETALYEITGNSYTINFISMSIMFLVICLLTLHIYIRIKKLNQKNLEESALELYFTNSVHAGFVNFMMDEKCKIIYASKGYYDIIGYSKEEVQQNFDNHIISFVYPDDYDKFKSLKNGLMDGDYIQNEVRMVTKDNRIIWILINGNYIIDKNGNHTISAVLVDITESKQIHERLLLEEERYRVAVEISNDILFEYDIKEDIMKYADKYKDLYGSNSIIPGFSNQDLLKDSIVHPDDIGIYSEYCRLLKSGKEMIESEFRIGNIRNEYIWCHIRGKTIYDDNRIPIRVIGKLVNIDLHKKELEKLEYKAKRDPLTGVYNKITTKDLIDHFISKHHDSKHIFMIVDIDDFKKINDRYGHLQGDRILSFVISQVKTIFTGGEIIGRIGGDEFAVFVGDIGNIDTILMKAKLLQRAIRTVYCEEEHEICVSGSIGISLYPKDGQDYNQLMNSADKALYDVKEQGKNGYKLFT